MVVRERHAPGSSLPDLTVRVLAAFDDLRRAEAAIHAQEAHTWLTIQAKKLHNEHGFRTLGDFAREAVRVSPATAYRRTQLARALDKSPVLKRAFLEGRVPTAHALLIAPLLDGDTDPFWVELAARSTYKELKALVKETRAALEPSPDDDRRHRLPVTVPASVAVTFEAAVDTASKLEGRDLSRADAFDAMLSEAGSAHCPPPDETPPEPAANPESGAAPRFGTMHPPDPKPAAGYPWHPTRRQIALLEDTLTAATEELEDIAALTQDLESADPLITLRALRQLDRPLRRLRAHLLHDAVAVSLPLACGHTSLASWARTDLRMSERKARDLLAEARFSDPDSPAEQAYAEGAISGLQTRLIQLLTIGARELQPAYVDRAVSTTHLHFQREARLQLRIRDCLPGVPVLGPLPDPRLEHHLTSLLHSRGVDPAGIADYLAHQSLPAAGPPADTDPATDPATDPVAFRRLESLVELCILTLYPDGIDDTPAQNDPQRPADRQTLRNDATSVRITLTLPEPIHDHWLRLRRAVMDRHGPLPDWAVFGYVVCAAALTWERHHGAQKPANHRILERDAYRCTAPGCTARKNLEVHHIVFRSRQGTDAPENLTTLCAFHHRQSIHLGSATLTGSAPDQLHWSLGAHRFHGHRRT